MYFWDIALGYPSKAYVLDCLKLLINLDNIMSEITACTMDCPDACSLIVSSDDDGSATLKGNPEHPFTAGFTCAKIKGHIKRLQSSDRILDRILWTEDGWKAMAADRRRLAGDQLG
jgi:anaerobic selenocysteine-containing dehydrogenase